MSGKILPETKTIEPTATQATYLLTLRDYMQQLISGTVSLYAEEAGIDFTKVAFFEMTPDASVIKLTMKDPEPKTPVVKTA